MHAKEGIDKTHEVLQLKQQRLADRSGNTKAIVKDLRNWVIDSLGVRNAGDNSVSFLRDTISPLLRPGLEVYDSLEKDIFG